MSRYKSGNSLGSERSSAGHAEFTFDVRSWLWPITLFLLSFIIEYSESGFGGSHHWHIIAIHVDWRYRKKNDTTSTTTDQLGELLEGKEMPYCLLKAYSLAEMLSSGTSRGYTENWAHDAVLITAKAVVDTVNELSKMYPEHLVQKAMINRILRGVLWTIHNASHRSYLLCLFALLTLSTVDYTPLVRCY